MLHLIKTFKYINKGLLLDSVEEGVSCNCPILMFPEKKTAERTGVRTCPGLRAFFEISSPDIGQHFQDIGHDL